MSWRGSMIHVTTGFAMDTPSRLLPVIHPAAILRQWDLRYITVHDLRSRVPMALAGNWTNCQSSNLPCPAYLSQCVSRLDHWLRTGSTPDLFALLPTAKPTAES